LTQVVKLAEENKTQIDVCVAKPGLIKGAPPGAARGVFSSLLGVTGLLPTVDVTEAAASMLHQVVNGFGPDGVLTNEDMVKIGQEVLKNDAKN